MRYLGLIFLACSFLTGGIAAADAPDIDNVTDLESFIDGIAAQQMIDLKIAGVSLSIVKDGHILLSKGYGYDNIKSKKKVDPETSMFRIGSVGKLFTATAVMQLYEAGEIDLDADVNTYLDFKIPATFDKPVTLANLLTHTGGFDETPFGWAPSPDKFRPMGETLRIIMPKRIRAPGTETAYSNYGMTLAGYIVERVSGVPYEDYIADHILKPLNMRHCTFKEITPLSSNFASGYLFKTGYLVENPEVWIHDLAPAGSAYCSANDMAQFMMAHLGEGELNGSKMLERETSRLMHSVHFTNENGTNGMAYGFMTAVFNGMNSLWHGGQTPLFHTRFYLFPEKNIGIYVSYNSPDGIKASHELAKSVLDRYFPEGDWRLVTDKPFKTPIKAFSGAYRSNISVVSKAYGVANLFGDINISVAGDDALLFGRNRYERIGDREFRSSSVERLYGDLGRLVFLTDKSGKINRFIANNVPIFVAHHVPWWRSRLAAIAAVGSWAVITLVIGTALVVNRRRLKESGFITRLQLYFAFGAGILNCIFVPALFYTMFIAHPIMHQTVHWSIVAVLTLPLIALIMLAGAVYCATRTAKYSPVPAWVSRATAALVLAAIPFYSFLHVWNLFGYYV